MGSGEWRKRHDDDDDDDNADGCYRELTSYFYARL